MIALSRALGRLHRPQQCVHFRDAQTPMRAHRPMAGHADTSFGYRAALDLVFKGVEQPSGYTEPLLHAWRQKAKAAAAAA